MKPIIGVMPLWDEEKESIWMVPGYLEGIQQAGGFPIILPFDENIETIASLCDGFLFTGGQDVNPALYHEQNECSSICQKRDALEQKYLEYAIKKDKAVLGICRGIQFLNAFLGGTLYQDLPSQYPSKVNHHQSPPYEKPIHKVCLNGPLQNLLQKKELAVNSYHHQGIKQLAPSLEVMAIAEDGLIEGVYKKDAKFIWAIQWHPEFSYKVDINSQKIFQAFVGEAGDKK